MNFLFKILFIFSVILIIPGCWRSTVDLISEKDASNPFGDARFIYWEYKLGDNMGVLEKLPDSDVYLYKAAGMTYEGDKYPQLKFYDIGTVWGDKRYIIQMAIEDKTNEANKIVYFYGYLVKVNGEWLLYGGEFDVSPNSIKELERFINKNEIEIHKKTEKINIRYIDEIEAIEVRNKIRRLRNGVK